jgi:hypothetical protein
MNLQKKIRIPEPQYLYDASGKKSLVVFTIEGYETLLGHLHHTTIAQGASVEKSGKQSKYLKNGKRKKSEDYYGILKSEHPEYVTEITEDKEIWYDV